MRLGREVPTTPIEEPSRLAAAHQRGGDNLKQLARSSSATQALAHRRLPQELEEWPLQRPKIQLGAKNDVIRCATLLRAVIRIERIKHLARTGPEMPAASRYAYEFKPSHLKRTAKTPRKDPKCHDLSRLGAYGTLNGRLTGNSLGGGPGSITIRHGLDRLTTCLTAASV